MITDLALFHYRGKTSNEILFLPKSKFVVTKNQEVSTGVYEIELLEID